MGKDKQDCGADHLLTTGDMARLGNSTLRTIRFYESQGLLKSTERCGGGHRRFEHCELTKLQVISGLRDAGVSLEEIGELMALKARIACPQKASAMVQTALVEQRDRLDVRIANLQRLREEVDTTLEAMTHCHHCECMSFPSDCRKCERIDHDSPVGLTRLVWDC